MELAIVYSFGGYIHTFTAGTWEVNFMSFIASLLLFCYVGWFA